jgi:hypothetical protein
MVAQMVQVIFDGIYGETTNVRLQRSALSFLQWCARMVKWFAMIMGGQVYSIVLLLLL